ncbi:MAG: cation acetate symporter [Pirellulales bacterium]
MIYTPSATAIAVFALFVAVTLGLSFYLGRRTRSAHSYFAAGGQIHWFVNGVAFAGDYLSAASFLGICGMIAFSGYDGFLYSIGYLAGWIVALLVVAEPLKRLGKYTFADALDAKFQSPGIKLAAGISTLVVSLFYLIPQMVGAGALVKPLLGFSHVVGVCLVGAIVMLIVVTAGMVSTTYVQFLKGSLLVVFSAVLTVLILNRGLQTQDASQPPRVAQSFDSALVLPNEGTAWEGRPYVRTRDPETNAVIVWRESEWGGWGRSQQAQPPAEAQTRPNAQEGSSSSTSAQGSLGAALRSDPSHPNALATIYYQSQTITTTADGKKLANGLPQGLGEGETDLFPVGTIVELAGDRDATGPLGPFSFLREMQQSTVLLWVEDKEKIRGVDGAVTTIYYPNPTSGADVMTPGQYFSGLRQEGVWYKLNFLSLMLALFLGTASLPHILIRYYTVKDQAAARKSTVVGIGSIGFFYVLTLYIGLGAMTSGALDVTNSNMAAPLLARSFGELLFAIISAIAFTTVLGTVAGLIVAASGAVVHDLLSGFLRLELNDHTKVRIGRIAAVCVGLVAIVLGILFEKMNVSFLVGWAFSVAAGANMPSLAMLLFWKGTTRQGIIAGILVGMISSLGWILLSADTFKDVYGLSPDAAWVPFSQPGIVTIPLGFATVWLVSLMTNEKHDS